MTITITLGFEMKKRILILFATLFILTACQEEKAVDKTAKAVTATTEANSVPKVEKTEVAQAVEAKTSAPTAAAEKNEDSDKEESGASLHKENCAKCHAADYYPKADSKMDSYKRLHTMVGMCDAQLGTELFPEELQSITDYLNDSFYKFKK
jgi:mono/diheme cytochrome c family protein